MCGCLYFLVAHCNQMVCSLIHVEPRQQSLGDMERFDDSGPESEEEADHDMEADMVGALHFGGGLQRKRSLGDGDGDGADEPNRRRSRKEIMEEVVMKAKKHKLERQEQKRTAETLTEQVDADLDDIRLLLMARSSEVEAAQARQPRVKDSFDVLVRQLAFESKAHATDRLKTPQEIATQEHEHLQKLEADRLRRMRGDPPTSKVSAGSTVERLSGTGSDVMAPNKLKLTYQGDGVMRLGPGTPGLQHNRDADAHEEDAGHEEQEASGDCSASDDDDDNDDDDDASTDEAEDSHGSEADDADDALSADGGHAPATDRQSRQPPR